MIALVILAAIVTGVLSFGFGVALAGSGQQSRAEEHREALGAAYQRGYVRGRADAGGQCATAPRNPAPTRRSHSSQEDIPA